MEMLHLAFAAAPWGVYAFFLMAPFVQEDAAIVGAAAAAMSGMGETGLVLAAVLGGLIASDLWKYWAGRAALTQAWARKRAEQPAVAQLRDKVVNRLGVSLFVVRFVPGTRVPFYLAAGYFRAPFAKFAAGVALSALAYVGLVVGLSYGLGGMLGAEVRLWLPALALIAVLVVIGVRRFASAPGQN